MTKNDLYKAAFRYKKSKLWKKLWDNEVFAVYLSNGHIGYVSVMGKNGEYNAIGLYLDNAGFQSYRIIANAGVSDSEFKNHEMLLQQRCLQMALESVQDLLPDEANEVRTYAQENGIRLTGKNAFPHFMKYEPNRYPWKIKTESDMRAIYETLIAASLLAELLTKTDKKSLGIFPIGPESEEVPLFGVSDNEITRIGDSFLPGDLKEEYEYVVAENQLAIAAVKKLPKNGIWESELIRVLDPVQDSPDEVPYYPTMLMVVDNKAHYVLPIPLITHVEEEPQELLQYYAHAWKSLGSCPKEVRCRDERTYALLKDFSEKTGVKISIYNKPMVALDSAEHDMYRHITGGKDDYEIMDRMASVIGDILVMDNDALKQMPEHLMEQLKMMIEQDVFPKDIAHMLRLKLKGI